MPSYHWREAAVGLIYSRGYLFSLMRMPFTRGPNHPNPYKISTAHFCIGSLQTATEIFKTRSKVKKQIFDARC
jgi:hypothetical protein